MKRVLAGLVMMIGAWLAAPLAANASCVGVNCSCTVTGDAVTFGSYNPTASGNIDVAADIKVKCTSFLIGLLVSYDVLLDGGQNGTMLDRKMSNGVSLLSYNLYRTAGRTTVWGDGTGGTGLRTLSYLLALGASRTDTFTAYGRLPGLQNVSAGSYSDTVVATVVF